MNKKNTQTYTIIFSMSIIITLVCMNLVNATILEKDYNRNKYQTINTENIIFEMPVYATHYWTDSSGNNDLYEIIINDFSIKGDKSYILRLTWNDKRYISESLQIHYEFKNGVLTVDNINPISLAKTNPKLTFKNLKIEIGTLEGYETKLEMDKNCDLKEGCEKISVTYPVYSWKSYDKITTTIATKDFIAIDDVNVSACGTLSTENEVYTLNASIIATATCFTIGAENITLDFAGNNIDGDDLGTDYGVYSIYNFTVIKNGYIYDFDEGIYLKNNQNNKITNMTLNSNWEDGIWLSTSKNNIITNITLNTNDYYGIIIGSTSINNTFTNITLNDNDLVNIRGGSNNIFTNVIINGKSGTDDGISLSSSSNNIFTNLIISEIDDGILFSSSSNNIFTNVNISANGDGVYFQTISNNNTFINAIISGSGGSDVDLYDTSINNTFLNCSYNNSKESVRAGNVLIRKWYFDAQVNYKKDGLPINGASVIISNSSNSIVFSDLTDGSGTIPQQTLTEYINTNGVKTYSSPYTILTRLDDYPDDTQTIILLDNENVIVLLSNVILIKEEILDSFTRTVLKLIVGFLALIILSVSLTGIYLSVKNNFSSMSIKDWTNFIIILLISTTLFIVLINYIVTEVLSI